MFCFWRAQGQTHISFLYCHVLLSRLFHVEKTRRNAVHNVFVFLFNKPKVLTNFISSCMYLQRYWDKLQRAHTLVQLNLFFLFFFFMPVLTLFFNKLSNPLCTDDKPFFFFFLTLKPFWNQVSSSEVELENVRAALVIKLFVPSEEVKALMCCLVSYFSLAEILLWQSQKVVAAWMQQDGKRCSQNASLYRFIHYMGGPFIAHVNRLGFVAIPE